MSNRQLRAFEVLALGAIWAALPLQAYAKAKPGRYFVDAKGETVVDNATQLIWQRGVPAQTYKWQEAKNYCKELALAGGGWRLPWVRELRSIVDREQANPKVDPKAFPGTPSEDFWSATPNWGSSSYAWYVHFGSGDSDGHVITAAYRVRCVR